MALKKKEEGKNPENKFPPISVHNKASKYITLNDDSATLFFMKTGMSENGKKGKSFPFVWPNE